MYRFIPFVAFATLTAGCSGATHAVEQQVASPSATTTRPAARTAIRDLPPVAKLTAACTLLSSLELKTLLGGGSSRTKVTATEAEQPTAHSYECKYGSHGTAPFALVVEGLSQQGFTPKMAIGAITKSHRSDGTRIRIVSGVGETAVFLTFTDGVSELMASKRSHGQTRLVGFDAPRVVPERKFVDVAELVINRV